MIFCFIGETCKCFKDGCSNYTFKVESFRSNWENSRQFCKETGLGDLVSIENDGEWTFLKNFILNLAKAEEYFIGLRSDKATKWKWLSNKSTLNESYWARDEPNGDGRCAVICMNYSKNYGKYNDLSCTTENRQGYICELSVDNCDQEGKSNSFYIICT